MKLKKVFLVGAGGTSYHLAQALAMQLLVSAPEATVTIIDFDIVSDSNITRQYLPQHIGKYKAVVLKEIMEQTRPGKINCILDAWTKTPCLRAMNEVDLADDEFILLIGAPDNNATRKELTLAVREFQGNVIYITPGNGTVTGQISTMGHINGKPVGLDFIEFLPEIAKPRDFIPRPGGCYEEIDTTPQLVRANKMAAALTLYAIGSLLDDGIVVSEVHFSKPTMVEKVFDVPKIEA